jgi:DNA-binding sugar fermentation-stimulating protein
MEEVLNSNIILTIGPLIEGVILKRPSKHIKSPYVADVLIQENEVKREIIAHSASLGCCGMAEENAQVLLVELPEKNNVESQKCSHRICLSIFRDSYHSGYESIVGIYPKLAEQLAENALKGGFISSLKNIRSYKRETVIKIKDKVDSRFDFSGIDENGIPFVMEIKNVPIAYYEETPYIKDKKSKSKKEIVDYSSRSFDSKVAYFPDGYRKKSTDTISPRALKHVKELTIMKTESSPQIRTLLCFVIQRDDVECFKPSSLDPEYKDAVKKANESGVEIIAMVIKWNKDGTATFIRDDLPIYF